MCIQVMFEDKLVCRHACSHGRRRASFLNPLTGMATTQLYANQNTAAWTFRILVIIFTISALHYVWLHLVLYCIVFAADIVIMRTEIITTRKYRRANSHLHSIAFNMFCIFWPCDLDLWPLDLKIIKLVEPEFILQTKFEDFWSFVFELCCGQTDTRTYKQTDAAERFTPAIVVGVSNNITDMNSLLRNDCSSNTKIHIVLPAIVVYQFV